MLIQIIAVIIVFGGIVVIHEAGHFISARSIGIAVQEFAVGVGPAVFKGESKGTLYSVRALPCGGFCLFDPEIEGTDHRGRVLSLTKRDAWTKIFVSVSGPLMNFLLAAFLFTMLFSIIGVAVGYEPVIGVVHPDSAAFEAGIQPGDRILSIEGENLAAWQDLSRILTERQEQGLLHFTIQRGQTQITIPVTPRWNEEENRVMIGVSVDTQCVVTERVSPAQGIRLGLKQTRMMIEALISSILQMMTGRISVSENLSGPVALIQVIGETASDGIADLLFLTAFLSVNLGIMNLLPFPALDGGRIVMYLLELLRRKPLAQEVESIINAVGFVLLISLMAILTFRDIARLFGGQ